MKLQKKINEEINKIILNEEIFIFKEFKEKKEK